MTLPAKRNLFFAVWLILLLLGPFTIFSNTPWSVVSRDPVLLINFFQRLTGLTLFTLIFTQVVLGSLMTRWIESTLGAKGYWFHITEGLVTYGLILAHPVMQSLIDLRLSGLEYALIRILPSFASKLDSYMVYGKVAFILFTIGVFAGYFRTQPFLRRNWKYFHRLNYVGFFFVAIHSWFIGTDTKTAPFFWFYLAAVAIVTGLVIYKIYTKLIKPYLAKSEPSLKPR